MHITSALSHNIAEVTEVLDKILSQSFKLDGRNTEAKAMSSDSAEFNEIKTLKVMI